MLTHCSAYNGRIYDRNYFFVSRFFHFYLINSHVWVFGAQRDIFKLRVCPGTRPNPPKCSIWSDVIKQKNGTRIMLSFAFLLVNQLSKCVIKLNNGPHNGFSPDNILMSFKYVFTVYPKVCFPKDMPDSYNDCNTSQPLDVLWLVFLPSKTDYLSDYLEFTSQSLTTF